ncbi:MAG: aminopeptidase P family protein [Alphaproteobacteria bacterium]|nr:aminopeptidase P family protein [Alphaproteobacteria bacterium]
MSNSIPPARTARLQTYSDASDPKTVKPRLDAVRREMNARGLSGYLVPRGDMFRGEYLPAHAERLRWLTSFTGSAGLAVIGRDKAALFVDGRYATQAPRQTDTSAFAVLPAVQGGYSDALRDIAGKVGPVGYDPWLFSPGDLEGLASILGTGRLKATDNLVDLIWTEDRPAPPEAPVELLGDNRAGKSRRQKLGELRNTIFEAGADALLITLPESVNWLMNMRGRDVPHTPFALSLALVPTEGRPTLFIDISKIGADAAALGADTDFAPIESLPDHLVRLGTNKKTVWTDAGSAPSILVSTLRDSGASLVEKRDPVLDLKSRKNDAEISGIRDAHRRDGVAMAKFLCWLDGVAGSAGLTEIDVVERLEAFRREDETLVDISFDTICGSGPNGAIMHYRVTETSNRTLVPGELLLVDSGAQYLSGTTDITRTVATGPVAPEHKDRNTRVLKGMIAISRLKFPLGTTGAQIDAFARHPLWEIGENFAHGTGHGVGAFLSVHEGPIGIAPRYHVPFAPGNVVSNEPGFYLEDGYGIRIENLVHVVAATEPRFLCFETLTLAPIDTRLIAMAMLTIEERDWLNAYHARVLSEIGPALDAETRGWLEKATAAV